jgi:hypothetical protein
LVLALVRYIFSSSLHFVARFVSFIHWFVCCTRLIVSLYQSIIQTGFGISAMDCKLAVENPSNQRFQSFRNSQAFTQWGTSSPLSSSSSSSSKKASATSSSKTSLPPTTVEVVQVDTPKKERKPKVDLAPHKAKGDDHPAPPAVVEEATSSPAPTSTDKAPAAPTTTPSSESAPVDSPPTSTPSVPTAPNTSSAPDAGAPPVTPASAAASPEGDASKTAAAAAGATSGEGDAPKN